MSHAPVPIPQAIVQRALQALTARERATAVAYIDEAPLEPGAAFAAAPEAIPIGERTYVAFVDREPAANWGHACRYLLLAEGGGLRSIDADKPPYLRRVPPTLALLWKGPEAPDWAIAARRPPTTQ